MNKRLLKNRKFVAAITLILVAIFGPYLWSRALSSSLRIQVVESTDAQAGPAKETLRVACYNIAHGRGLAESNWDGGDAATRIKRLYDIAVLLRKIDADVVVLNEVDFDTSWSNNVNQAGFLAENAGYPFRVEERNLDFRVLHRTWRFGNAILSKYPIANANVIDLPSYAGLETTLAGKKRGVRCDVAVGEKTLRIFGLHLSHRSEEIRQQSATKVLELVRASPHACAVMGDMNSTPLGFPKASQTVDGKNAIETFDGASELHRKEIKLPVAENEFSFRADKPEIVIDWIYLSRSLDFRSSKFVHSLLSDHRAVVAEFGWAGME